MNHQYISITDFMNPEQVRDMLKVIDNESQIRLGVGVMTSYKVMNGIPSKWINAFPKPEDIARIFMDHPQVFNVLHYADYRNKDLAQMLPRLVETGGPNLHAIQLDMVWPDPQVLKSFRKAYPQIKIILQVSSIAMKQLMNISSRVAVQLQRYGESVDYVLLDKSMGKGKKLNWQVLAYYINAIRLINPDLQIVVAGGLGPKTAHIVKPLIRRHPSISVDAQAQLRSSGNALDPINWTMATEYLSKMLQHFNRLANHT